MKRSTDRILTSHTGSLHMPRELQAALNARAKGEMPDDRALEEQLREAVGGVVRHQAELGVDVVNDGEFSKSSWMGYATERMSGLEFLTDDKVEQWTDNFVSKDRNDFAQFYEEMIDQTMVIEPGPSVEALVLAEQQMRVACTGPLKYTGHAQLQRDIANLKAGLESVDVEEAFLPVVAPASMQAWISNEYYPDDESFFAALAAALREEYSAIIEAGIICQIDDAFLPSEWDAALVRGWGLKRYREWAELAIDALNEAIAGLPEDRIRYHFCWGSWNAPHSTDVPLRDIVDLVLKVNAQTYSIEAANARHEWEYQLWNDVALPDGKILMPGVIEHTTHVVEHPETVADRIMRFANIVGRENVIAGTDCGLRARAHPQVAWAKLKALSEGAQIATERLWK